MTPRRITAVTAVSGAVFWRLMIGTLFMLIGDYLGEAGCMVIEYKPPVKTTTPDKQPAFSGFSQATFSFFKDLAIHQHRDWFATNK